MLHISIKKSKSKNFNIALAMVLELGGIANGNGAVLNIKESDLINSYNTLLPLIELIGKWKSVSSTYNGHNIDLYRFVFQIQRSIYKCGIEKTGSKESKFCAVKYDVPTWGCRLIETLLLYNTGNGVYERSGIYWYNYGFFDNSGMWVIDKERIIARIHKEITSKALDICPFFNIARIEQVVFRDLPDYIIPDNYNYRLHYEKVYENGNEVIKAVNIRHINDVRNAPGTLNKSIVYQLSSAHEYFKALPPDLPPELKRSFKKSLNEIDQENAPASRAFDNDGTCKN